MSNSIDKRIVEMEFDNQQFERGVTSTIGLLDQLKETLQFNNAARGLSALERSLNSINLDGISQSIYSIEERFSVMGIVAKRVIEDITDVAFGMLKKVTSATIGQIYSGGLTRALNIEQAKFQLEGLDVAWEDIKDDILYGVRDTAYGLDEAARVASQLVASGIPVGDMMQSTLRGISGVAAMTNSSYSEIGNIFTTIASNGKLMTMQLRQLSFRGLNVAAVLAKALNKTEEEINDMVSKGQISFEMFANAMNNAFGEQATKANETFTGSLSNLKAALSRIGADVAAQGLTSLRDIFNELRVIVDDIHVKLESFISSINTLISGTSELAVKLLKNRLTMAIIEKTMEMFATTGEAVSDVLYSIGDAFRDMFIQAAPVQDWYQYFVILQTKIRNAAISVTNFVNAIRLNSEELESVRRIFSGVFALIDMGGMIIREAVEGVRHFSEEILNLRSNGLDRLAQLGDYFVQLRDRALPAIQSVREAIINWIENTNWERVFAPLKSIKDDIVAWFQSVNWDVILQPIQNGMQRFAQWFHSVDWENIFQPLKTAWDWLKSLNIGNKVATVIGAIVYAWNYIKSIDFKSFVAAIASPFISLWNILSSTFNRIKDAITTFFDLFRQSPRDLFSSISGEDTSNRFQKVQDGINAVASATDGLSKGLTVIYAILYRIVTVAGRVASAVASAFHALASRIDTLKDAFSKVLPDMDNFVEIGSRFSIDSLTNLFTLLANGLTTIHEKISTFITDVLGIHSLHDALQSILDVVKIIIGLKFGDMLSGIGTGFKLFGQGMANFGSNGLFQANGLKPIITMGDTINGVTTGLNTKAIKDFAIAIAILAAALLILSSIDVDRLGPAVAALTMIITEIGLLIGSIGKSMSAAESRTALIALGGLIPLGVTLLLVAASIKILANMPWANMLTAVIGLSAVIAILAIIIYKLSDMPYPKDALIGAIGIQILAGSLITIGLALRLVNKMNWDDLHVGLLSLLGLFLVLSLVVAYLANMSSANIENAIIGAFAIQTLSLSLIVIGASLRIVNKMNWDDLHVGLLSLLSIFLVLWAVVGYLATMNKAEIEKAIIGAYAIQTLSLSLIVIGASLRIVNKMNWDDLHVGLLSLLGLFLVLSLVVAYLANMSDAKIENALLGVASIIMLSASLIILAVSLRMVNGFSWDSILPGLLSLSALFIVLTGIVVILANMNKTEIASAIAGAAAMVILSSTVTKLAKALQIVNGITWDSLKYGLIGLLALIGILGVIVIAVGMLAPAAMGMLGAAASIFIIASGVAILAGVVSALAAIPNSDRIDDVLTAFGKGLTKLIPGLIGIGLGGVGIKALPNLAKGMLMLIPALISLRSIPLDFIKEGINNFVEVLNTLASALFKAQFAMIAISIFSVGLVIFSTAMIATAVAINLVVAALNILMIFMVSNFTRLNATIQMIATLINQMLATVVTLIQTWTPAIAAVLVVLINNLLLVVQRTWPRFKDTIILILNGIFDIISNLIPRVKGIIKQVLDMVLELITEYIPRFVGAILDLIGTLLAKLAEKIPEFMQSGADIIVGILDGIGNNIGRIVDSGVNIVTQFMDGIGRNAAKIVDSGFNMVIDFINGVADAVRERHDELFDAIENLLDAGMEAAADWVADALEKGADFVAGLIEGLTSMASELWDTICSLGEDMLEALGVTLDEHSPSREAERMGRFFDKGLINGLNNEASAVASASSNLGNTMLDSMSSSLNELSDRIQNGLDTEPVIRPVMDLSDIELGADRIGSLLDMNQSVGISAAVRGINSVEAQNANTSVNGTGDNITTVSFTQNNYSPESLSRIDIYRDTRNALGMLGEWNNQ